MDDQNNPNVVGDQGAQDQAAQAEAQAQAPKDPTPQKARTHFKEHTRAITTAAARIGDHVAELEKTGLDDKQRKIARDVHTQVAQLHLAVNNAHAVPDDDDEVENTGGAADTSAVDPNPDRD